MAAEFTKTSASLIIADSSSLDKPKPSMPRSPSIATRRLRMNDSKPIPCLFFSLPKSGVSTISLRILIFALCPSRGVMMRKTFRTSDCSQRSFSKKTLARNPVAPVKTNVRPRRNERTDFVCGCNTSPDSSVAQGDENREGPLDSRCWNALNLLGRNMVWQALAEGVDKKVKVAMEKTSCEAPPPRRRPVSTRLILRKYRVTYVVHFA